MPTLAEQLEAFIVRSHLAPGARLPPERTLAADLGVSRSRLRETIQQLVSRGLIVSRRGGGNFIAEPTADLALDQALKPLQPLAESEAGYWRDIQEIRQSLETNAAYYAALRAGRQDKERLTAALDAVCAASDDAAVQSRADAAFHLAIAEASHNLILRQVMSGLFNLLKVSIAESLTKLHQLPDTVEALNAQHRSIVEAILAGRAEEARHAAALHLSFVEDRLRHIEEEAARLRRATALRHTIPQEDTSP